MKERVQDSDLDLAWSIYQVILECGATPSGGRVPSAQFHAKKTNLDTTAPIGAELEKLSFQFKRKSGKRG